MIYTSKSNLGRFASEFMSVLKGIFATRNQVGSPLKAATVSAMTNQNKIYVYTGSETGYTAGNWYYHNGTAWTSGGVYNAVAVNTDTTLSVAGDAADAKATGDAIADVEAPVDAAIERLNLWVFTNTETTTASGLTQEYPAPNRVKLTGLSSVQYQYLSPVNRGGVSDRKTLKAGTTYHVKRTHISGSGSGSGVPVLMYTSVNNTSSYIQVNNDSDFTPASDSWMIVRIGTSRTYNDDIYEFELIETGKEYSAVDASAREYMETFQPLNATMSMFKKVGSCGASWEVGYLYTSASIKTTRPDLGWQANLARRNGNSYAYYAHSGYTIKNWLDDANSDTLSKLLADSACDLYILNFGGNDASGNGTIGTIADITDYESYSDYPNTFYGNYGKVIEQIQAHAPNALFIMSMGCNWRTATARRKSISAAVDEIAAHYGFPRINWSNDPWYTSFLGTHEVGSHPTAATYSGLACCWERLFSKCVADNWDYFKYYHGGSFT